MRLPLRYYGDPILRKKCKPVGEITKQVRQLVADMIETMDASNGIGIAAPQVGHDLSLFVLHNYIINEREEFSISEEVFVFINPEISYVSKEMVLDEEGCLSIPKLKGSILRPEKIIIEATDLTGKRFKEELEGYNARVRLHENDHINGVLFIDRLDRKEKDRVAPLLREIKKKYGPPKSKF